jgi:hypothetical protein
MYPAAWGFYLGAFKRNFKAHVVRLRKFALLLGTLGTVRFIFEARIANLTWKDHCRFPFFSILFESQYCQVFHQQDALTESFFMLHISLISPHFNFSRGNNIGPCQDGHRTPLSHQKR